MRRGEIAQDRFGKWHFPVDQIASAFRQPQISSRFHWSHCPFCNEMLPNVSESKTEWADPPNPPPAEAAGDDQADGN